MSSRLHPSWQVLASHQTYEADRCVDVFERPEGTFGFRGVPQGPEDMGAWTPVRYYSGVEFATEEETIVAACEAVPWPASLAGR